MTRHIFLPDFYCFDCTIKIPDEKKLIIHKNVKNDNGSKYQLLIELIGDDGCTLDTHVSIKGKVCKMCKLPIENIKDNVVSHYKKIVHYNKAIRNGDVQWL